MNDTPKTDGPMTTDNLTKQTSADAPPREYAAKSGTDDAVHAVEAAPVDLVDPSSLRTRCDAPVMQVYTDEREVSCERCAEATQA